MKIYVMATVQSGLDILEGLGKDVPIHGIVGLTTESHAAGNSGFVDVDAYCRRTGPQFIAVNDYGLRTYNDRQRLEQLDIDVLLVLGWQRLIPDWLIAQCRIGALGIHGSADGITAGRGRSPQNWAILLGRTAFEVSLFWIDPGVDSGAVLNSRRFPLTPHDDIRSSYYKMGWHAADMIREAYASGRMARREGEPQSGTPYYLPQRCPEDGQIDWRRTTLEIDRFIRALARPYPGAFSPLGDQRVTVWRARPFSLGIETAAASPGQILRRFEDGSAVVRTGDGLLMLDEYECSSSASRLAPGAVFESTDFVRQMTTIAERHRLKFPDAPLSPHILSCTNHLARAS